MKFYQMSVEDILSKLNSDKNSGLTTQLSQDLLVKNGPNKLPQPERDTAFQMFFNQFKDILVVILLLAALISFLLGEMLDAYVVLAIVMINALMGYIQEAKAERALDALKKMETAYSKVIRDGNVEKIKAEHLVVGDIILIESGDKVPADCRLIEAINLEINESILTGESHSVKKITEKLHKDDPALNDQLNMCFKDTSVILGRGRAVVVYTGIDTEIGKISQILKSGKQEEAPLAKQLDHLGKRLSLIAGIIIVIIFCGGILWNRLDLRESFFSAVSLAVAAIPEGLPAIVTIVLAIGVSRLSKIKAVIRKLNSVETLGSTNFILTDKTGTLTQNKMTVTNVAFVNQSFSVVDAKSFIDSKNTIIDHSDHPEIIALLNSAVICSDVQVNNNNQNSEKYIGDPTEIALVECAENVGIDISKLKKDYMRVYEVPFSSETKKMLVVVTNPNNPNKYLVMAKGAPEVIERMVNTEDSAIEDINKIYTSKGLRSLAFSYKELSKQQLEQAKSLENPEDILSTYHNFMGIMAQKDPLRPEVKDALYNAFKAGIKTILLTGDNKLTATSIAKEIGLITKDTEAIEGSEIANLSQKMLTKILKTVKVFARVSPEQKLKVVEALRAKGNIVAVTGDGVNDAPAIKTADIGIAMGISGTDVSKEVADMVLEDDNYATIVEAIKQGRIVYDNLVKFIKYLISCNVSEILIVGTAVFAGLPLPLLPIQILWINLVTDGFPALSLGVEPGELDIMSRKPRNSKEGLLTATRWKRIILESLLITAACLSVYVYALDLFTPLVAQTAILTTLAFSQIFHTYNNRSEIHSIFSNKLEQNKKMDLTILLSLSLQLLVVYTPLGNTFFRTVPLDLDLLFICLCFSILPVVGIEFVKLANKMTIKHNIVN